MLPYKKLKSHWVLVFPIPPTALLTRVAWQCGLAPQLWPHGRKGGRHDPHFDHPRNPRATVVALGCGT